jgi:hypothetical protein
VIPGAIRDCRSNAAAQRRNAARTCGPSPRRAAARADCRAIWAAAELPRGLMNSPAVASSAARGQFWSTSAVQVSTSHTHAPMSSCSVNQP